MRTKIAAIGVGILLALTACADPPPDVGEIVEFDYDDPDYWTTQYCAAYTRIGNGTQICVYWATDEHHDGPHWSIRTDDGEKNGWCSVSETTFHEVSLHQWYDCPNQRIVPR